MNNRFKNNRMYKKGYKDGKQMSESVLLEKINNLRVKFINGEIKANELREKLNILVETNDGLIERNKKLISALADLNIVVEQKEQRINELSRENSEQKEQINDLSRENNEQKEQINDLTKETNTLANDLETLKNEQNNLNIELEDLKEDMKNAFDELDEIKSYKEEVDNLNKAKDQNPEKIMFHRQMLDLNTTFGKNNPEEAKRYIKMAENSIKQLQDEIPEKEKTVNAFETRSINAMADKTGFSHEFCQAAFNEFYRG